MHASRTMQTALLIVLLTFDAGDDGHRQEGAQDRPKHANSNL